ncbi:MAG: hypothetical protein WBQ66_02970 [Blastocatellia bacterium]|jgi:hypothetical protein
MATEEPIEAKQTKKSIKKQVKRLIRGYGAEKALVLVTELAAAAPVPPKTEKVKEATAKN